MNRLKSRLLLSLFLLLGSALPSARAGEINYKDILVSPWAKYRIDFEQIKVYPSEKTLDVSRFLARVCVERPDSGLGWFEVMDANNAARGPARWSDIEWFDEMGDLMDNGVTDAEGRFNETVCGWFWPNRMVGKTQLRWRSQATGEGAWTQTVTLSAFLPGAAGTTTVIDALIEEQILSGFDPDQNLGTQTPILASHEFRSNAYFGVINRRVYQDSQGAIVYDGAESNNDEAARKWEAGNGIGSNVDPALILDDPDFSGARSAVMISDAELNFDYEADAPFSVANDDLMGLTDGLGGNYSNLHLYLVSADSLQRVSGQADTCRSSNVALGDILAHFTSAARTYGGIRGGFLPGAFWSGSNNGDLAEWFNTNGIDDRGSWTAGLLGGQRLTYENLPLYDPGIGQRDLAFLIVESDESLAADIVFCNARVNSASLPGTTLDNGDFNNYHGIAQHISPNGDPTFSISFEQANSFETWESRGY